MKIWIFLKRSVREKGPPFGMTLSEEKDTTVEFILITSGKDCYYFKKS